MADAGLRAERKRQSAASRAVALALMVASGFAGLGWQIVWTQQATLWLGHENAAVLAVVAAFFGGLALGAWALGSAIERSLQPARWYAVSEAVIAGWGLALIGLPALAVPVLLALTGAQPSALRQWGVVFSGTFLLMLPATMAMGATLPAMERVLARWHGRGTALAALYAGNTAGAVLGVLSTAFWLVPALGLRRTALVCAGLNVLCALVAWRWGDAELRQPQQAQAPRGVPAKSTLWLLAATGLLGIGYEVLVVRVLSQVTENTVYTYAMLLAVYLIGTASGAAVWAKTDSGKHGAASQGHQGQSGNSVLLRALAWAGLFGVVALAFAPQVKAGALQLLGDGLGSALAAEALLAALVFLPATCVMGALFSQLSQLAMEQGFSFGQAMAANTVGAALAPPLCGVIMLPALGAKGALICVIAGYLLLSLWPASNRAPSKSPHRPFWLLATTTAAVALLAPTLALVDVPAGGRIVRYLEGPAAAVSVIEDNQGVSRLHINNRQQEGSSHSRLADARQALLPMLLHPQPRRALFLGLGTGVTASSAAEDRALQVDAVELLPEVIDASRHFTESFAVGDRLLTISADARRFVRSSTERYDLIVADNFHPARSGSGALYTVEHFRAVHERLADGGIFCQWLPLHQLDLVTLRSIVRSFVAAHPQAWAVLATHSLETPVLGLIAQRGGRGFDTASVRRRIHSIELPREPARFGLADEWAVLGSFVAGPASLARLARDATTNTDDHPVVMYQAPRITYAPDSTPAQRLLALLHALGVSPAEVLAAPSDAIAGSRLAAYWRARDRFIEAGQGVRPTREPERMLAQVRGPLFEVLRTSSDFRPAYDPLLSLAVALGPSQPEQARRLLVELIEVQPTRPEAPEALFKLTGAVP